MKKAIIYFLVISAAEIFTIYALPGWGISLHIATLIALIVHSAMSGNETDRQFLLSLSLVPLIRIISLSIPLQNIPQVWWYPIIYVPLFIAGLQVTRLLGLTRRQTGLVVNKIIPQVIIALSGVVLGFCEYFILRTEAEATYVALGNTWLLSGIILVVCTGFVEEFTFRGIIQHTAVREMGWKGIIYVALIFGIVHIIHKSIWDILFVSAVGLYFGLVVKKTGSILGVTVSHGIANIILFLIAPIIF